MTTAPIPWHSRRYQRHGMLPQLVAFEAVVRLGSVTRAADALYMAQPTVSGHLRKLAEALGVRLFVMRGKHLVPTDAALALLTAANEVFDALDRCEQVLATLRGGTRADARLACRPDAIGAAGAA
ncbi:MAG: LysR family transcriptional regulator [Rhizobacter sp.]|nr:LysR family transcriptional regulator [Rhizobacter sp.]